MLEDCPKCGHESEIIIEPSNQDEIHWRAKCSNCRTDFFGVFYPKQAAPVVRLEDEDSPTQ